MYSVSLLFKSHKVKRSLCTFPKIHICTSIMAFNTSCVQTQMFSTCFCFLFQTEATSPAEPVADKPVQTSLECVHKPPIEKPHRASVDRATPNQDAANKSPPPAPPRRLPITATGLTTGRSGEVIFTTRQDPAPPQVCVCNRKTSFSHIPRHLSQTESMNVLLGILHVIFFK